MNFAWYKSCEIQSTYGGCLPIGEIKSKKTATEGFGFGFQLDQWGYIKRQESEACRTLHVKMQQMHKIDQTREMREQKSF